MTQIEIPVAHSGQQQDITCQKQVQGLREPLLAHNPKLKLKGIGADRFSDILETVGASVGVSAEKILKDTVLQDDYEEESLFCVDLAKVAKQLVLWHKQLPSVYPHYAVKCCPDPAIVRMLADMGAGFDCASKAEIQTVLGLGVPANRIVYANPCKQASALKYAAANGVELMTYDNADEVSKVARLHPRARLVLRIAVDDSQSTCRFNSKFGADLCSAPALLRAAATAGLHVEGVSFHVGSGCGGTEPFADAVSRAKQVFRMAKELGMNLTLLDIGGGFPGDDDGYFNEIAATLRKALEEHFPRGERETGHVRFIAEPGRYFATQSHAFAVSVIARKRLDDPSAQGIDNVAPPDCEGGRDVVSSIGEQPEVALYIADGVYGAFNCVVFDHAKLMPEVLRPNTDMQDFELEKKDKEQRIATKLFGPTCDSIDVVIPCLPLPQLQEGDWLLFHDLGAYTRAAASGFNGFGQNSIVYTWSKHH